MAFLPFLRKTPLLRHTTAPNVGHLGCPTKVSFCSASDSAQTVKGRSYVNQTCPPTSFQNLTQAATTYCCVIRMTLKKNNVFVNLTKTNGQTIIKFSAGLIQKKKNKKVLRPTIKWILERITFFVKKNFNCVKVVIKGHTTKSFSYLKEIKRKKLKLISFQNHIPIVHNGCRPPKKRRI